MATKYKHLFFDLDRTLWDFEINSKITLKSMYQNRKLFNYFDSFDEFIVIYKDYNKALWSAYKQGKIRKQDLKIQRFVKTLEKRNVNNLILAQQLADDYVVLSPEQTTLFPHTIEVLHYLKTKYKLYIITNGFVEIQYKKIKKSGLEPFFSRITTSEEAKASKPNPKIFHYALSAANAKKTESILIGDDWENDIMGAQKYGIDQIFFNPEHNSVEGKSSFEIDNLLELQNIL